MYDTSHISENTGDQYCKVLTKLADTRVPIVVLVMMSQGQFLCLDFIWQKFDVEGTRFSKVCNQKMNSLDF